jgi:hypothetical protein
MDAALHMILHPVHINSVLHLPGDCVTTYLLKCKQNIEAEVWSLVCNSRQSAQVSHGSGCIFSVSRSGVRIPCEQLWFNLLIFKGNLCLITRTRADGGLMYEKGKQVAPSHVSCLVGYVKPYIHEYAAIVGFLTSTIPSILCDLAVLSVRTPFAFDKRPLSAAVPCNTLQRQCVLGLSHTVEGIQGPPGTGKSSTIFHIVHSAMPLGMVAIVTCVQNRAVDALACKFQSGVIPFLVLGSPDRLGDTAKQYALETRVENVETVVVQRKVVDWVARILDFLHSARRKRESRRQFRSAGWKRWWALYSSQPLEQDLKKWSLQQESEKCLLDEARLKGATLLTSCTTVFLCTVDALCRFCKLQTKYKRKLLIIDEAGTVPEFKIPLAVSLGVEAVIAVGDQNQLQPFTHTGIPNGFFHRLAKTAQLTMLEEQFRMHPEISGFVSSAFYSSKLFTNPAVASARCSVPHSGVHWVDYPDTNAECSKRGVICNHVELDMLRMFMKRVVSQYLSHGKSVMLITFYREQFHLLMVLGEKLGLVGTRLQGTKTERFFVHPGFRISTVDASQGSESDVIVLSCVRSNPRHDIGFLSKPNRVCVALSRAREHLIVLGSAQTLTSGGGVWERLFSVSQRGLEVSTLFQPIVLPQCPFITQASPL